MAVVSDLMTGPASNSLCAVCGSLLWLTYDTSGHTGAVCGCLLWLTYDTRGHTGAVCGSLLWLTCDTSGSTGAVCRSLLWLTYDTSSHTVRLGQPTCIVSLIYSDNCHTKLISAHTPRLQDQVSLFNGGSPYLQQCTSIASWSQYGIQEGNRYELDK
ncbi:hypothetical protein RRG08_032785 [Elysia crispata]|uniref:Uncharacterized protein n=1 Tax=Elysia crispata TaxID=231223 RepID=A0AAE1D210_9GAST|nr:hypothetical protein RRG08_032785 [Elysia crispata]